MTLSGRLLHVFVGLALSSIAISSAAAQGVPRLDPLPVAPAAAVFQFKLTLQPLITAHPSGCVLLFDDDASQVVCIEPASGRTHRFGRAGAGPGEFSGVRYVVPTPDGRVITFDWRQRRLTTITPAWKLGGLVPEIGYIGRLIEATNDSVWALGGTAGLDVVSVSLHDGGIANHFSPATADSVDILRAPESYDRGFWITRRPAGGWYVAGPWSYHVLVEDDHGTERAAFDRDLSPEMSSPAEVAADRRLLQRMNPHANVEPFVARMQKDPKPAIAAAPVVDSHGRLWVLTGRIRADSTEVDVFDPRNQFLGTVRIPGTAQAIATRDGELFFIVQYIGGANDGEEGIVRYQIR